MAGALTGRRQKSKVYLAPADELVEEGASQMANTVISPTKLAPATESATHPVGKPATDGPTSAQSQSVSSTPKDTVQISTAAQAQLEAIETPTQTVKEARSGDPQAQRLLAKELAAQHTQK